MSIRRAADWLFGLGDDREAAAPKLSRAADERSSAVTEVRLYGEAEAIRVLYQVALLDAPPPKPPRPRGRRGLWMARYLNSFGSPLPETAGAKA
jgi:hypothetical protein